MQGLLLLFLEYDQSPGQGFPTRWVSRGGASAPYISRGPQYPLLVIKGDLKG